MQKQSSKSESMQKTEQNRSGWKILTMVKVNGQSQRATDDVCWRGSVTSPRADVAGREAAAGACGAWVRVDWHIWGAWGAWQVPAARGARAREVETSAGACDAVSSRSWLGFARDWLFCLSMPVLWQLNAQNVDIRVLPVLWAWRRWLASDSDDWMKARAAEERQRCPQEPESQRNGSDTILTI